MPPAWARSVAAAGLSAVPLFVQPDSWSFAKVSDVLSGRDIVATREAESNAMVAVFDRGSVICVSCPPDAYA